MAQRKQHIEQTRKDKCAQRKWHSIKQCALDDLVIYCLFFSVIGYMILPVANSDKEKRKEETKRLSWKILFVIKHRDIYVK